MFVLCCLLSRCHVLFLGKFRNYFVFFPTQQCDTPNRHHLEILSFLLRTRTRMNIISSEGRRGHMTSLDMTKQRQTVTTLGSERASCESHRHPCWPRPPSFHQVPSPHIATYNSPSWKCCYPPPWTPPSHLPQGKRMPSWSGFP